MSDAKHTPAGDASFRSSLLRNGAGAVGLVVLVALIFWSIGTLGGETGTPIASDTPETDEGDAEDGDTEPDEEPTPDPEPTEEPEPDADDGEDADADADAEDDGAGDGDADDGETDDGEADDGATSDRAVAPGEVTIQVLDGFKEDGGAAADQVAALLGDVGYQVIARNDALSYDVTTVLYNPGNEEAARQVAADLGGAEVREQPGNLSSAVSLHVVVGRDRG